MTFSGPGVPPAESGVSFTKMLAVAWSATSAMDQRDESMSRSFPPLGSPIEPPTAFRSTLFPMTSAAASLFASMIEPRVVASETSPFVRTFPTRRLSGPPSAVLPISVM